MTHKNDRKFKFQVSISKMLGEYSRARLFMYHPRLFSCYDGRAEEL